MWENEFCAFIRWYSVNRRPCSIDSANRNHYLWLCSKWDYLIVKPEALASSITIRGWGQILLHQKNVFKTYLCTHCFHLFLAAEGSTLLTNVKTGKMNLDLIGHLFGTWIFQPLECLKTKSAPYQIPWSQIGCNDLFFCWLNMLDKKPPCFPRIGCACICSPQINEFTWDVSCCLQGCSLPSLSPSSVSFPSLSAGLSSSSILSDSSVIIVLRSFPSLISHLSWEPLKKTNKKKLTNGISSANLAVSLWHDQTKSWISRNTCLGCYHCL